MARLELRKVRQVSKLDLAEKPITIGRSSSNDLVLSDTHVSRQHCVIEHIDGQPHVRDLNSHGGTYVNGKRAQQAPLFHGDRISVGPFDLLFKDPSRLVSGNGHLPDEVQCDGDAAAENSRSGTAIPLQADRLLGPDLEELESQRAELAEREQDLARRESEFQERCRLEADQENLRVAQLRQELEASATAQATHEERTAELMKQVEAGCARVEQLNAEVEKLTSSQRDMQLNLQNIEAQHGKTISELNRELVWAHGEIERLQAHETTLQEQVDALQTARRAALDRAEQSASALASLRGRVRILDDSARKIAAVQERLSEIESAFVEVDEQLENASEIDDQQLERAAMQRQRFSDELESLNQVRDAAVTQLTESAQQLRAAADQQPLQITFARPMAVGAGAGGARSSKRWWRFGR